MDETAVCPTNGCKFCLLKRKWAVRQIILLTLDEMGISVFDE
jgi:hypothetical protein